MALERRHELDETQLAELHANRLWCAGDDGVELIACLSSCVHRGAALQPEQAEDLDIAILRLWNARRILCERSTRRRFGINRIRLAALTPQLSIGTVDLDDGHPGLPQRAREPGAIRTRALHTDAQRDSE